MITLHMPMRADALSGFGVIPCRKFGRSWL